MFGFGKKAKIDAVFIQVTERMASPGVKRAEELFQRTDVESLFAMSGDVATTVEMILLWRAKPPSRSATWLKRLTGTSRAR